MNNRLKLMVAMTSIAVFAVLCRAEEASAASQADSMATAIITTAEPTDSAISAESAEPAESAEATESAVSAEPTESTESTVSSGSTVPTEPPASTETAEKNDDDGDVAARSSDAENEDIADGSESSEIEDVQIQQPEPAEKPAPIRFGQVGRLDGIAAVVGSEIILYSELEAYAYMRVAAMGDPAGIDADSLLRESLDELIDNKVMLVRAIEDSTINVRNDEVESTLNNHINNILRQNSITMEQFESLLRSQQGTTLARFRTEARRAIREQLYKQKLQQSYYFSTKVNRRDVERFFEMYGDSLPEIGESFEVLKLSLRLTSSDSARMAALDEITAIKRRLDAGENFEELAKELGDPSGGDLGYLVKGSTTEIAFEDRAFSLPVGRVSEPFETRLGYHVIVVEEKRDLRVKLRQILVRHVPTEQEREALLARLDSLRRSIDGREAFEAAARSMSTDAVTRGRGGDMGWLSLLEMPAAMRNAVQNLEDGQISAPVTEDNTLSIYMVNKRVDSRRLTLENDYAVIAEKARDIFAQQQILDNVKRWRERVFIDVRI